MSGRSQKSKNYQAKSLSFEEIARIYSGSYSLRIRQSRTRENHSPRTEEILWPPYTVRLLNHEQYNEGSGRLQAVKL